MMTVEHVCPQSTDGAQRDRYNNCVFACTFCNTIRNDAPLRGPEGQRLLDPTKDPWDRHFRLRLDVEARSLHLEPVPGDTDAIYTAKAYDLGDPQKGEMRYRRLRRIDSLLSDLEALTRDLSGLETVARQRLPGQVSATAADKVGRTSVRLLETLEELMSRWRATPGDAPRTCRCTSPLELPVDLAAARVLVEYDADDLRSISVSRPGSVRRAT